MARPSRSLSAQAARWLNAARQARERGERLAALELLERIITTGDPDVATWNLTVEILLELGEFAQARTCAAEALQLDPRDVPAQFQAAVADYQLGNVHSAVDRFTAVADQTDALNVWCNWATILPGDPQATPQELLRVRREFARRLTREEQASPQDPRPLAALAPRHTGRGQARLRVGYVSAYFTAAHYMRPVWNLLQARDSRTMSVHLFADGEPDTECKWFEPQAGDQLRWTQNWSNRELATEIRAAQLDVVVDLNGYSVPQRLGLWTYRLAPRMVAWFNMYATSGLSQIDCLLGDRWVLAEDDPGWYSEQLVELPCSCLSCGPPVMATPPVASLPANSDNQFTFGSLISQYKLVPEVLDAWAAILRQTPNSRLRLGNRALGSLQNREYLQQAFARRGVAAERLEFLPPAANVEFLGHYDRIDLALDAFPYNGGTTTTEALWQGVPVVCLAGDRWASRTSQTLLENVPLPEFIAADVASYVAVASAWSQRKEELAALRATLRDRMLRSSLCQAGEFAQMFADALRKIAAGECGKS